MNYSTGSGTDMLCGQCGRPVVGMQAWGVSGPYHPECVKPPQQHQPVYYQSPDTLLTTICAKLDRIIELLEEIK